MAGGASGPFHRAAIDAPPPRELRRITFSAARLYVAELEVPRGGAPGSIGNPSFAARRANPRTWPHCEPTNDWTSAAIGKPPLTTIWPKASGCQNRSEERRVGKEGRSRGWPRR